MSSNGFSTKSKPVTAASGSTAGTPKTPSILSKNGQTVLLNRWTAKPTKSATKNVATGSAATESKEKENLGPKRPANKALSTHPDDESEVIRHGKHSYHLNLQRAVELFDMDNKNMPFFPSTDDVEDEVEIDLLMRKRNVMS